MYEHITFTFPEKRPFFYSNFVQTIDGKVAVSSHEDYWPIGNATDYATLLQLRAHADVLMHGKTTALSHKTVDTLARSDFQEMRSNLSKTTPLLYAVVSGHPGPELIPLLTTHDNNTEPVLVTTEKADLQKMEGTPSLRLGEDSVDLAALSTYLFNKGYRSVLIEGGPQLMGAFFAAGLMDEMFLTIAPKVFGGNAETSQPMSSGPLIPAAAIPAFHLAETHQINDELFLRYIRTT